MFGCNDIWLVCVIWMEQTCYCNDDTFKSLRCVWLCICSYYMLLVSVPVRPQLHLYSDFCRLAHHIWASQLHAAVKCRGKRAQLKEKNNKQNWKAKNSEAESEEKREFMPIAQNSPISKANQYSPMIIFQLPMPMQFHKYCKWQETLRSWLAEFKQKHKNPVSLSSHIIRKP